MKVLSQSIISEFIKFSKDRLVEFGNIARNFQTSQVSLIKTDPKLDLPNLLIVSLEYREHCFLSNFQSQQKHYNNNHRVAEVQSNVQITSRVSFWKAQKRLEKEVKKEKKRTKDNHNRSKKGADIREGPKKENKETKPASKENSKLDRKNRKQSSPRQNKSKVAKKREPKMKSRVVFVLTKFQFARIPKRN